MARIILLDLNYTLVANSRELGYPFYNHIDREEYRVDLWRQLKDKYVILITVRPAQYREATLARIQAKLDWQPQEAYFNR